jgi:hypothetical protein
MTRFWNAQPLLSNLIYIFYLGVIYAAADINPS